MEARQLITILGYKSPEQAHLNNKGGALSSKFAISALSRCEVSNIQKRCLKKQARSNASSYNTTCNLPYIQQATLSILTQHQSMPLPVHPSSSSLFYENPEARHQPRRMSYNLKRDSKRHDYSLTPLPGKSKQHHSRSYKHN